MLGSLFKPAWQSPSAEKRLHAIAKLDTSEGESLAVLETLAKEDPELEVRKAAAEKLPALTLFSIASSHPDQETKSHAEAVFAVLIGPKSTLTEDEFRVLLHQHTESRLLVARLCPFVELRSELLSDMQEQELAELISDIEYAETRKLIAERLESLEHLEQARKALKGKDKSAEKIIKSKIDAIRAKQKQDQENRELAESLCDKIEYLNSHDWRPEFKGRFLACTSQWDNLDFEPEADFASRFVIAKTAVEDTYKKQERLEQCQEEQQAMATELEQRFTIFSETSLADLIANWPEENLGLQKTKATWQELSNEQFPRLQVAEQFAQAESAFDAIAAMIEAIDGADLNTEAASLDIPEAQTYSKKIKGALSCIKLPLNYPEVSAEAELKDKLRTFDTHINSSRKEEKDRLDKLHKRINRLLGSSNRGELGRAKRELDAVTKAAERYSGKDRASLDERIAKATESVAKMGDWKDFATEPKYIELCEAMEALGGSNKNPEALATEIKSLQDGWKALGYSESSDQHWERFKSAGDKAYEPCAAFFTKRKETRKANLAEREKLVDSTRNILEGTAWDEEPDYKEIDTQMRQTMNDWKKIKDVEQKPGQKQWKRFSKIRSDINAKLDLVFNANIELKHQLIQQAEALVETELKEESLPRLQQLQTRWKQIGITRRKDDQAAWKKFKAATDAVYEKIQGVRQSKRDEENQQLDGYRGIIKQIQSVAKTAKDLAEADHRFEQLQSDYQELPPLPKGLPEKLLEGLQKDYRRACDSYSKSRDRIVEAAGKEELNSLREKARLCSELERLAAGGKETEIERLKSEIDEIEIHDKAIQRRFDKRLAAASDEDKAEATEHRRLLCIDLEILLGVESPEEDRELRMQIQFERMKTQGIGRNNLDKKSVITDSKLDWLCLPGAAPEIQATLEKRFQKLTT